jgi:N-acetylmuramoyl-L-alanine amidase
MKPEDIEFIVIHCTDSPHRGDTAADIHRWHQEKDWSGIGYHKVILEDGTEENGRPLYWEGAHAYGYNSKSWGIALFGTDTFTKAQIKRLRTVVQRLLLLAPNAMVVGHCDLDTGKTCPNMDVIGMFKT